MIILALISIVVSLYLFTWTIVYFVEKTDRDDG